jgi:hypothetical protein
MALIIGHFVKLPTAFTIPLHLSFIIALDVIQWKVNVVNVGSSLTIGTWRAPTSNGIYARIRLRGWPWENWIYKRIGNEQTTGAYDSSAYGPKQDKRPSRMEIQFLHTCLISFG